MLPQSPGAVRGADGYLVHMDYLVTTLTRELSGADQVGAAARRGRRDAGRAPRHPLPSP
jgi:hypothetical protein